MNNVIVRKDQSSNVWYVSVAGIRVVFEDEANAFSYAAQLSERILAPHKLPQSEFPDKANEANEARNRT